MKIKQLLETQLNELKTLDTTEYGGWIGTDRKVIYVQPYDHEGGMYKFMVANQDLLASHGLNYNTYPYTAAHKMGFVRFVTDEMPRIFSVQGQDEALRKTYRAWAPTALTADVIEVEWVGNVEGVPILNTQNYNRRSFSFHMPHDKAKFIQTFTAPAAKVNEVELIPTYNPGEKNKDPILKGKGHDVKKEIEHGDAVKLGTYKNHTIYMSDEKYSFSDATNKFFAIDNETGLPTIFVSGILRKKKTWMRFTISLLQSRKGNKFKADEFYRYLMLKLPLILVTYQQSIGGLKVWQKLSSDPQLTVFGWKNGKAVNVDPRDEMDTHATHNDAYSEPESKDVYKIALIAHRKIK